MSKIGNKNLKNAFNFFYQRKLILVRMLQKFPKIIYFLLVMPIITPKSPSISVIFFSGRYIFET